MYHKVLLLFKPFAFLLLYSNNLVYLEKFIYSEMHISIGEKCVFKKILNLREESEFMI